MICNLCCSTVYSLLIEYTAYIYCNCDRADIAHNCIYSFYLILLLEYAFCDGAKGEIPLNRKEKGCYSFC